MASDDEAMPEAHKDTLDHHLDNLVTNMEPTLVVAELVKRGVFDRQHRERVFHEVTCSDRNLKIVELLKECGDKFLLFVASLRAVDHAHSSLADSLAPIKQRVLWLVSSPSVAAAVVHVLNKYSRVRLSNVEGRRGGRKFLVRRGFFDSSGSVEVCLVFPVDSRSAAAGEAMAAAFTELHSSADVAVMSGGCEGVRGGEAVVTTTHNATTKVKDAITLTFSSSASPWIAELRGLLQRQSRLHYEGCWLTRLQLETDKVESDPADSSWLRSVGWDVANAGSLTATNSSVLSRHLYHWLDGGLTAYLLQGAWHMDPTSLLRMLPSKDIRRYVTREIAADPAFPSAYVQPSFTGPRFLMDAAPDSESTLFLDLCSEHMPSKPAFVCKTGAFQMASQRSFEAISSSCIVMEAISSLLTV